MAGRYLQKNSAREKDRAFSLEKYGGILILMYYGKIRKQ